MNDNILTYIAIPILLMFFCIGLILLRLNFIDKQIEEIKQELRVK